MIPSNGPKVCAINRTVISREEDFQPARQRLIGDVVVALFDQDDVELRERIGQSASDDTSRCTT